MQDELMKRCLKYSDYFANLCSVECLVVDMTAREFVENPHVNRFCDRCHKYNYMQVYTHLYGCNESYRWNGKYIYYCPLGLVFVASPVSDHTGSMVGGLVAGPVIMGNLQDTLQELPSDEMKEYLSEITVMQTSKINDLAEILAAVTSYISGIPHSKAGTFVYEQSKILSSIYDAKEKYDIYKEKPTYPIELERKLQLLIRNKDKEGSQKLLNEFLGQIYFSSQFNLDEIKARVLELVVLLSRATIDAGADMNEIFCFSTSYLKEVERFESIEELSVWLTGIVHRFINYSFDFTQIKHFDAVYKAMEFIKSNYDKKLTLDEIAQNAYLSKAYLSSIFKEETGESLSNYINKVRIEKSKIMLMDNEISLVQIAHLCGFEDQSYFTRVFKKAAGVSPKKYRESRGIIERQ